MSRLARIASLKTQRGRRNRPGVESLEQRLALAVSADLVSGQLLVVGTAAADVITLDHSGSTTTVAGKTFADSAITAGILIQAGDGDDTFNLRGTARPVTFQGQQGRNTVNVGRDGSVQDVRGSLDISNNFIVFLNIDNHADTQARTVTIDLPADLNATGRISGLAPSEIRIRMADLGGFHVQAGAGNDTFEVLNVRSFNVEVTSLDTGAGDDTVNVRNTVSPFKIEGHSGVDTVNVGSIGGMRGIAGALDITNSGGQTTLNLNDQGDTQGRSAIIDVTVAGVGEIRNLSPGKITYNAARVAALTVNGGSGGNTFFVFATATGRPTTLNAGSGFDTVKVGSFFDKTDTIQGPLKINGQGSQNSLEIIDVNSFTSRVATLDVAGGIGTVTGMSPATIAYAASDFSTVSLRGSSSGNVFTVANTAANATTTLNSGFAADTVNIFRTSGPLNVASTSGQDSVNIGLNDNAQSIKGAIRVSNGQITKLTVNDGADLQGRGVTLSLGDLGGITGVISGLTPAPITYVVNDIGTLTLNSGSGADTYEVGAAAISPVFNDSININTRGGNDRINVRTIVSPRLAVDAGTGDDRIDAGSSGNSVGLIRRDLSVIGGDGNDVLNVLDGGALQASFATLDVVAGTGTITGLAPGVIRYRGNESLNLFGGSKGNSFTVANTLPGIVTTLNSGTGVDTVSVLRASSLLVLDGQAGRDSVSIGLNNSVQEIRGTVTVSNNGDFTSLFVLDSLDAVARQATLALNGGFGTITGLAPATIRYATKDLRALTINAGPAGNTFVVEDTSSNLVAPFPTPTTLNTGTGNDRVVVKRVTDQLIVNGQSGRDSIEFGLNGSTSLLKNDVTITNVGGFTALTINAQADAANRLVDFTTLVDGRAVLQGLAVTRFFYPRADVSDLTINTGIGKDTFVVRDTIARGAVTLNSGGGDDLVFVTTVSATSLTVNAGAGNDRIFVSGANSTLDSIFGQLIVNGGEGTDTLSLEDRGSKIPRTYTQTDTAVIRDGRTVVTFTSIEALSLLKGPTNNPAALVRGLALRPRGTKALLTGRLTDPDGDVKLALTVDWGDGSMPAKRAPGIKPFVRSHRYRSPGLYSVRVIWTDAAGESNSRDIPIRVFPRHHGLAHPGTRGGPAMRT